MRTSKKVLVLGLAIGLAIGLSGCVNLFSPMDKPSGDAQLISAAEACLDAGDWQCALNDYQQVSSSNADIANSGEAYAAFDQQGATMAAFAGGFGNGKLAALGTGMTSMANSILAVGAGQNARVNIYNGFIKFQNISNSKLAALVQFLGSIAFSSEILAEIAPTGATTLTAAAINANTAITCTAANSTTPLEDEPLSTVSAAATFDLFNAAVADIKTSLNNLSASGTLANEFNSIFGSLPAGLSAGYGCQPASASDYDGFLTGAGIGD